MDDSKVGKFDQLVRPMVTISLTGGFLYGFIVGKIDTQNFVPVVIMAIGFWFGARGQAPPATPPQSSTKITETDPTSGAKREVTMTAPPGAPPPEPTKGVTP